MVQWTRARFWVEIVLAVLVGVAAFVVAAVVSTAARSHMPAVLLDLLPLLAAEVFAAVTEEAARLLHLGSAHLVTYERDQTATVVGSCDLRGSRCRSARAFLWKGTASSAACSARNSRPGTADVHRRVLAVLAFLDAHDAATPASCNASDIVC